jgi:hypothetical protein
MYYAPPLPARCVDLGPRHDPDWDDEGYCSSPPMEGCTDSALSDYRSFLVYQHVEETKVKGRKRTTYRAWLYHPGSDTALFYAAGGSKGVYTALQAVIDAQVAIDTLKGRKPLVEPVRKVLMEEAK